MSSFSEYKSLLKSTNRASKLKSSNSIWPSINSSVIFWSDFDSDSPFEITIYTLKESIKILSIS